MEIEYFLEKFGLSQYEKQTYLTLIHLEKSKSREISKKSGVSYGRIYEVLDKLEKKGLIQTIPTIPKTFEVIDPKIAFKLFLRRQMDDLTNLKRNVDKLKDYKKPIAKTITEKTLIIHGKKKQLSMNREMDERATREILVIPGIWHPKIASDITYARVSKRGVKVKRILRNIDDYNKERVKYRIKQGEEIRKNKLMGLRLHVVDRREGMLVIVDEKTKDRISIYTSNKDFANSLAIMFNSIWKKSKPIKH